MHKGAQTNQRADETRRAESVKTSGQAAVRWPRLFSVGMLVLGYFQARTSPLLMLLLRLCLLVLVLPFAARAAGLVDHPWLGDDVIYLDGNEWTASSSAGISISATVPGDLITDLERAGVIEDPLYEMVWIEKASLWDTATWTYSRVFNVSASTIEKPVFLVFDGIKMSANISLNGKQLDSVFDQFVRYVYNVQGILKVHISHCILYLCDHHSVALSVSLAMMCSHSSFLISLS